MSSKSEYPAAAAASKVTDGESNQHLRYFDLIKEPIEVLLPVEGYQDVILMPLDIAVEGLEEIIPDVQQKARIAKARCREPCPDGLTQDESAAILLYTFEWIPYQRCLYYRLNETLRSKDRRQLIRWFPYLKLVLTALFKLPSVRQTVYRGVKIDKSQDYQIGAVVPWWGFSSCTDTLAMLESEQFLGNRGTRTLFNIECFNGKVIKSHSYYKHENEVLILPATQFRVISKLNPAPGLHIIQLREITDPEFQLLEPPFTIPVNRELERLIKHGKNEVEMDLDGQQLTDQDIKVVVKELKKSRCWKKLSLASNRFTSVAAAYLSEALEENTVLTALYLYNNQISDNGTRYIFHALKINQTVKEINLNSNYITGDSVSEISETLRINKTLERLLITGNKIRDRGMQSLTNALKTNTTLLELYVADNNITDASVTSIVDMLEVNRTLTSLSLRDNQISDQGKHTIRQAARKYNNLSLIT
ncbi:unnamed protein product [Didymodactylos carnosus]|uniref:NAD(P)(+)--arginine ADP-ribosyltransferase n=1 Tax=Didymodactylos carnosus TaxID=1234261 RepID=A0A814D2C9_9BILA|nr:unnamed protein product [Didymodactylos carnosus]CAF1281654.1 unnamed protein product [Didymodactylos carnosus]CAF3724314.1 unnamed protein product [Didymodactylos carnosus]CAF4086483.1 unnamed protein product [Didymodactylos carnosus]